jgi:cytoplasmic polyadenylation element-binding protein
MRNKEVQVIPWIIADSSYVRCQSQRLDPQKTVFVGALHGMLNAEGLCNIFNDLFGGVVYAGIDTDKYKYPIGSARVTFNNHRSYMRAVAAAFIEIKTSKFTKKVQVDPYLEDALCSACQIRQGPYFCRDMRCFKYFCRSCWEGQHEALQAYHKPLMRNCKYNGTSNGLNVNPFFTPKPFNSTGSSQILTPLQ